MLLLTKNGFKRPLVIALLIEICFSYNKKS